QDRITHHAPVSTSGETDENVSMLYPRITTHTSDAIVEPGSELYDNIEVTGLGENYETEVESTLYFVGDERPEESEEIPDNAEAVETVTTEIDGDGEYQTPAVTVEDIGYYTWVETIEEDNDRFQVSWTGNFGISDETSLIKWEPTVTTETSDQRAEEGDT